MRPPKLIWLYTLADLWRVILLTTAVLCIVIAFASTVRHTAEGKLGPLETLRFMLYAMPPMLQYALPFAAGFGATLAFHRMTQDNEITAASASGVGHKAILVPALISGIIIAGTLSFLSGQVIPRFLRTMEQMITLDITKVLTNSIRSGIPIEFSGRLVHAGNVYKISPPRDEGAIDQFVLTDLSALQIAPSGAVIEENFAKRAWLTLYPSQAEQPDDLDDRSTSRTVTVVALKFEDAQSVSQGKQAAMKEGAWVQPIAGGMRDDPKFLTTGELAELPSHPDRYGDINQVRRGLALAVVERQWIRTIDESLRKDRKVRLIDSTGREYTISAAGLDWADNAWVLKPPAPGRDIEVERTPAPVKGKPRDPSTHFSSRSATLKSEPDRLDPAPIVKLTLTMKNVSGIGQTEAAGVSPELAFSGLRLPDASQREVLGLPSLKLLDYINETGLSEDHIIGPGAKDLRTRITNLGRHVLSKQHERAANIAASLIMVLAGAVTALRLGSCLPLTVYLWSFFPAVLTLITISAGQQATRGIGIPGLFILWGGVVLLIAYTAAAYTFVRRH